MKILLVSNYQPPHMGGIEYAARSLKACWGRDGHHVTMLTTDIPRGAASTTPDTVRVPAANFLESLFQINSPLVYPWARSTITGLLRSHDVVNVHSLAPGLSTTAARMAISMQKPMVITQHVGIIDLKWKFLSGVQHRYITAAARRTIASGARLTFVGQAVRDWFVREADLDTAKIHMTPAGIDQATYYFVADAERNALRVKWKLPDAQLNVLFVGRFYEKKGLHLIREVAARCPEFRFTLVGGGPIDPTIWALPNVKQIGFVSDAELRELYGSHDLFLLPSHGEGWPAVIPQAMACGLACLISEECFGGYGKDVDRFLVRKRDAAEISETLLQAASGSIGLLGERNTLAAYARDAWDWQRTARIYADLFRMVTARK